jgi:hypothetical protein
MKKGITINLDIEVIEELQKLENYSSYVNALLREHFSKIEMEEDIEDLTTIEMEGGNEESGI